MNDLLTVGQQNTAWINADLLLVRSLGDHFREIKESMKICISKCQQLCLALGVIMTLLNVVPQKDIKFLYNFVAISGINCFIKGHVTKLDESVSCRQKSHFVWLQLRNMYHTVFFKSIPLRKYGAGAQWGICNRLQVTLVWYVLFNWGKLDISGIMRVTEILSYYE